MNPSTTGWIRKFGHLIDQESCGFSNYESLYQNLKVNGFVYGIHLGIPDFIETEHTLTEDEIAKINLLSALYFTYRFERGHTDFESFVETVFTYYQTLDVGRVSFLNKILTGKRTSSQLEKLIDSRIYLSGNAFNRAMGNSLTNSLLYIDVLIFATYLRKELDVCNHAHQLEYVTMNLAYHTLTSKEYDETDKKLIKLLQASLSYVDVNLVGFDGSYLDILKSNFNAQEKTYLLDIACLIIWEDKSIDYLESEFIFGIGKDLEKSQDTIIEALKDIQLFFAKNSEKIPYLNNSKLASKFYDGMSKNVSKLILRNSKRLKKELEESKELLSLLSQSTLRELDVEERKKVQGQLLDVFKSIPSLAIFMLPGGAVLLPIFIKLIPKLLPSAFDENRIEKN